ncbi:MAG: phage integrase SAM-like domain-containing protein [Clostridia bacterium]|nr:phage integrase SAM-like domain-containing protein [Clostridia bacterium]
MVSNKRKEIIIDSNMTVSELSLLFLENKYNRISLNSYGTYQDRLEIINEYLGDIKLKDFRKDRINNFENYLNNERRWNYTFKPSNKTINEIMNVLNQLLKAAIRWNLLDKDYNCIAKEKVNENERINLKELQDKINNFQKIRLTNSLDKIWNRKK